MRFNYPHAFWLLLALPLLYFLRHKKIFIRPSFHLTVSDWNGRAFSWKNRTISMGYIVSTFLFMFAYILFVLALADPVMIHSKKEYTSRGAEIVFVLDVSPSMAALDIATDTRLAAAKKAIRYLVSENNGASYGLIACGLEAALLVPPTMDYDSFLQRLNDLSIGELGDGSAIGTGLATAVYHLVTSAAPSKTIVLLTDGENNAGSVHPLTAADLAVENAISIFVAGIGTKGTVPVKYADPKTGELYSGYLDSTFDDASLKAIAAKGQGRYFSIRTLESLNNAIYAINRKASSFQTYQMKQTKKKYYSFVLSLCLFIFVVGWLIRRVFIKQFI